MFRINFYLSFYAIVFGYISIIDGHGMMLEPVNRGSLWRYDPTAPRNYNDNAAFCGGFYTQWSVFDGKCGLCGDSYGDPTPRAHENGGLYGAGVIVRNYTAGESVEISVKITTNHKGYFLFHLCNLDWEPESEECFDAEPLELLDGGFEYHLPSFQNRIYKTTVVIPPDVICNHCVLRWTYQTANSWGMCADGTGRIGCGPQEQFKGCADVAILPPENSLYNDIPYNLK